MNRIQNKQNGSAIIVAVLTLAIISLIGAAVLLNCTTRYNASSKQVKAWNEALYSAEAGADVAFAEVRKIISSGSNSFANTFNGDSWSVAAAPTPGPAYSIGPKSFHVQGSNGQTTQTYTVTVDRFTSVSGFDCYRIRSVGTAALLGLARTGMDDRLMGSADTTNHFASSTTRGAGDSLVRKIDFKYDHFLATYGDGDGNSKQISTVSGPQATRRIETVAVPQWAITGSLKATGSFNGPGSSGLVDSYNSKNGAYTFVANNPASPLYADGVQGDVEVATSSFNEGGPIYGNVTTNGGNVTHANSNISGTIDNNVPFSIPNLIEPSTAGYTTVNNSTISPSTPANAAAAGTTAGNPLTYVYNGNVSNLQVNGATVPSGANAGKPLEIYVRIVVNGNLSGGVTLAKGVNAQIYFTGDLSSKAGNLNNNSVDGATGQYNYDGTASIDYSRAGHMQFFGVSPTDGSTQTISIDPPGNVYAAFYAPSANFSMTGNPDVFGAIVVHNFTGNGNTGFHYDTQLAQLGGVPIDYKIASYVEDIR